jgi:hypothetical protein
LHSEHSDDDEVATKLKKYDNKNSKKNTAKKGGKKAEASS